MFSLLRVMGHPSRSRQLMGVLLVVLLSGIIGDNTVNYYVVDDDGYPLSIPVYPIRQDIYTKKPVSASMVQMKTLQSNESLQSVLEFRQTLQCISKKQYIRNERGIYEFMAFVPHTNETVERIAAWLEGSYIRDHECASAGEIQWLQCQELADEYKKGRFSKTLTDKLTSPQQARLIRVVNQTLFIDFPWGMDRFPSIQKHVNPYQLINRVLKKLKPHSIGDSVFIIGEETSITPSLRYIPFPIFSNAAAVDNSDLTLPWQKEYSLSLRKRPPTAPKVIPFEDKIDKAAFYGNPNNPLRMLVYDAATLRPDLFSVGLVLAGGGRLWQWNILADDKQFSKEALKKHYSYFKKNHSMSQNLPLFSSIGQRSSYTKYLINEGIKYADKYKYLVVMDGPFATADRLADFLKQGGTCMYV